MLAADNYGRCTKSIGRKNAGNLCRGRKPEHQYIASIGLTNGGTRRANVDSGDGKKRLSRRQG
jgi:hypothetical protein